MCRFLLNINISSEHVLPVHYATWNIDFLGAIWFFSLLFKINGWFIFAMIYWAYSISLTCFVGMSVIYKKTYNYFCVKISLFISSFYLLFRIMFNKNLIYNLLRPIVFSYLFLTTFCSPYTLLHNYMWRNTSAWH